MASSHASASLPIRASLASSRTAVSRNQPLSVSLQAITSHDQVLASWSKAIDLFNSTLTKDESKKIDLTQFPRAEFAELLSAANTAKERVEQKRHSWTKNLQNVFRHINRYAVVGDIIVQHHAEYTSLVWGAFRFLLLFAVEEHNSSDELSKALETVIQIVFRAEEYANLFSTPSSSSTDRVFRSLHENLVRLFAEILNFLIRTTRFFEKPTLSRFVSAGISPFHTKFQSILKQIEDHEHNVEKDKSLLESEARKTQQEYENGVWLKHADFETDFQRSQQVHILGTCQWFLKSQSYLEWRDPSSSSSASGFLWIQGKPGSGKSVLASQIIQDLQSFGDTVVIYVFCKNGEENKNTLESILRNLIFELLDWPPQKQAFHRLLLNARLNEKSQYAQSIEMLWSLLTQMIREVDVIHCLIDGLDECQSSRSERISFLSRLIEIFTQRTPHAKLALISQLHLSEAEDHSSLWTEFPIQPSSVRGDIELLASTRIEKSRILRIHPEKDNLLKQLVVRSDGMILWTELMIKELEAGHWNIHNVLQKPPKGLFEMWRSILQRISHFSAEKTSHTLQLVLAAARPLSHEELALGLAVAQGLCQHEDYDTRGNAMAEGKLVVQEMSPLLTSMPDNTVQLTHSSLKDYLLYQNAPSLSRSFDFNEQDVHAQMSTVLIKYMSFRSFQAAFTEQLQPKYFLLEYATRWLVYHSTQTGVSTQIAEILVVFFGSVQGWKWLERLSDAYGLSFGHLQLLQSDLASWAQSSCFSDKLSYPLSNFLLILAQNRLETMKSLPDDDTSLLISMENLAKTFRFQGRWKESEELLVQVVEISKGVLGAEHPNTLLSMSNLAWTFNSQGRYIESEKLSRQIIEVGTRVLGSEHPDTLTSMHTLALNFYGQGQYKESEKLNMQVLETRTKVLGSEHPDTLSSMHNLALNFDGQGRYKESEELNIQILETSKRMLGSEHPDTLMSMHNLAGIFRKQKRLKEAEELYAQVGETRTRVLGAEHPDTLISMHNLALTFDYQGRYEESEKLNIDILETKTRVLGAEHPETLMSMYNLAGIFREQKRWKQAEELYAQVGETRTRVLGAVHPDTLMSMHNLALTFDDQGRYEESEKLNIDILETKTRVLGAEHPDTLMSMHDLALTFDYQGRYEESKSLNMQLLDTKTKILGAEHPDTQATLNNLAWNYHALGSRNEAIELMEKVVDLESKTIGPDHPDTLGSVSTLNEWSSTPEATAITTI